MKVALVGGGASGLVCAFELKKLMHEKAKVTVFEKNDRVGKKLLSTGNGRCNMTNLGARAEDYFEAASFVSHAFEAFPPKSNIEFFGSLGMFTHADSEGRVYPLSNQASGVLDVLRFACERAGVKFRLSEPVRTIKKKNEAFVINEKDCFDKVVLCAGSKAAVKDFGGYDLLSGLSHAVTPTAPSLVKLVTSANETKQFKGIRATVKLTLKISGKTVCAEKGELLFGDNVLSGIAAMQLSPYVSRHFLKSKSLPVVCVDFVPDFESEKLTELLLKIAENSPGERIENLLLGFMPKKIGEVIIKKAGVPFSSKLGSLRRKELGKIASLCKSYEFEITSVKSFSEAQVVTGGARLDRFNEKTLESKTVKGLYCCGELLDVDGPCGGYNLQWAWSSGRLCAKSIANLGEKE